MGIFKGGLGKIRSGQVNVRQGTAGEVDSREFGVRKGNLQELGPVKESLR